MPETGDTPREITYGILKHLQKPSKLSSSLLSVKFSQHASSTESKIDSTQKYHRHKQPTDQIDQQLNISSLLTDY